MFNHEELELIDAALTDYWLKHHEDYERQKAKGRKKCSWHLSVMDRVGKLHLKISSMQNSGA